MTYAPEIEATLFEAWYFACEAHTIPSCVHILSASDTQAMAQANAFAADKFSARGAFSDALRDWVEKTIAQFEGRAFLRSGYGMFKETAFGYGPVTGWADVAAILYQPDRRQARYVCNRLTSQEPAALVLRQYVDLDISRELRLFARDSALVGACPLYQNQRAQWPKDIGQRLVDFHIKVRNALPLRSVVIDVSLEPDDSITLIELNPFLSITDPIRFSWQNGGTFDGTLRL